MCGGGVSVMCNQVAGRCCRVSDGFVGVRVMGSMFERDDIVYESWLFVFG